MSKLIILVSFCLVSLPSYSYLGPGMGGGILVAVFGFFAAILIGLYGVLYYPIKRAFKNRKKKISPKNEE